MQRKHLAVLLVSLFLFSTGTGALSAGSDHRKDGCALGW